MPGKPCQTITWLLSPRTQHKITRTCGQSSETSGYNSSNAGGPHHFKQLSFQVLGTELIQNHQKKQAKPEKKEDSSIVQGEWDDNRFPRMLGCLFGSKKGCSRKLHSMAPIPPCTSSCFHVGEGKHQTTTRVFLDAASQCSHQMSAQFVNPTPQ